MIEATCMTITCQTRHLRIGVVDLKSAGTGIDYGQGREECRSQVIRLQRVLKVASLEQGTVSRQTGSQTCPELRNPLPVCIPVLQKSTNYAIHNKMKTNTTIL
jgi:hypothetical protein